MKDSSFIVSPLLLARGIPHGFGTRHTPPAAFPSPLYTLAQVHGDRVVTLAEPLPRTTFRHAEADALVTALPRVALGIRTADCLPVLLADPASGVVGAVHCGWRSLAMGILGKTAREMGRIGAGTPAGFLAALGPCIRGCCYEVGREVREAFARHPGGAKGVAGAFREEGGRLTLDLPAAVRAELAEMGLAPGGIDTIGDTPGDACTRCRPGLFHSWRGERTKERMTSWISPP